SRRHGPRSPGWQAFLRNHTAHIAGVDLFVVPTIGFKLLYGLVILRLGRRRLVWTDVTANPTAEWIATGARFAFSAKRSRFFSESSGDTQCVRYDVSIAGFPLRLKRSVWRRGVRATYAVWLADNPLAVAQDRNCCMASEIRGRLVRTTSSRQSICPRRQRSTARGSSHPIPTRMSMALTKCRAASAASAALATRSASGTRSFRLIPWSNSLFRAVQRQRHPPSADTCSRSCRRCFARRS
ncbi:MAG TPA: hypothetical protein VKB71_10410, partial [Rhizomicrobium sp.]|nr:hypothetical protein [Rhizomicrobium sp.]